MRTLLESQGGWMVCGEADNGKTPIETTKELKPNLVILDIAMPVLNGFEAARASKNCSLTLRFWLTPSSNPKDC
jgi:two-component system, NarL family, response regulator NreC